MSQYTEGHTPLRIGMDCKVSTLVLHIIIIAWPDAIKETNANNRTVLHYMMEQKAPPEVVRVVLRAVLVLVFNQTMTCC